MVYVEEFEAELEQHRRDRRVLYARNIPFAIAPRHFEADARARLSHQDSVTFHWPPPRSPWYPVRPLLRGWIPMPDQHTGYVMLVFDTRANRQTAETELGN